MADMSLPTHAVHYAAHAKPIITHSIQGLSMLTLLISNVVTAMISVGLSWYIAKRGMAGVKIDLDNAKKEVEALSAKITSPAV